jgi:hypothetical protein
MIKRDLEELINKNIFSGKAIIITGPRQVGKTTLLQQISENLALPTLWLNCDEPEARALLTDTNLLKLSGFIGQNKLILIDEAQRVKNIGLTVKLIVDNFKEKQVILTGSSSLDINNEIKDPLTGRKYEFMMFPFSFGELVNHNQLYKENQLIEQRLIYGAYPEIVNNPEQAKMSLINLTSSYLFKDILAYNEVRKPIIIEKLTEALALQLGNEVSIHELSKLIGVDNQTIERYISLLEQSFVIFRLRAYSNNLRTEIKKSRKIYFYDNGIRNAIINNFNPLSIRNDVGALWENYIISERIKKNHYKQKYIKSYFWRTFLQQEIDLVEIDENVINAYEIKWNPKKNKSLPKTFSDAYNINVFKTITPENYFEFLM